MKPVENMTNVMQGGRLWDDAVAYAADWWQRAFIYTDIMRKRGNNYLEHVRRDQPPVLVFPYEMVMDGRKFDKPVNYALVRITERRREPAGGKKPPEPEAGADERRITEGASAPDYTKRPIVVIDPRAGHGPGIGGSKLTSQIGVALNFGHPVYFILFFTDPEPGQTIYDVQQAEVRFLEEVNKRHPDAEKPAVIGNCQAGWAAALIGADRPDIVGPMVFNGSPLSYWGGVEGANPMRYRGGLYGGVWLTSLFCDLGDGKFDGANLVAGFEDLNPANTLWTKQYNLWRNVDREEERYLNFEKWWGGFFKMNREEIHFIVDSLFVGNELESGFLQLQEGKSINLKRFQDPIVVFASMGDNITPPQQALNWIVKVYGTVDEIKRNGQVIVYMVHERIGHLGIFVSGSVAAKEHTEILTSVRMIEYLAPGLYEMVITEDASRPWLDDYKVEFAERDMDAILKLDDGLEDELAFRPVAAISRFNDKVYNTFAGPVIRRLSNPLSAEWLTQLHPLRVQRYAFSDLNPALWPVKTVAEYVKTQRTPVGYDNMFRAWESLFSDYMTITLDTYREVRDACHEYLFRLFYDNEWMRTLFGEHVAPVPEEPAKAALADEVTERELWRHAMKQGGFAEGVVRIIIMMMGANKIWNRGQFGLAGKIIRVNDRLKKVDHNNLKLMIKQQAMFLSKDEDLALETLLHLLPNKDDRIEAYEIANTIATGDLVLDEQEEVLLERIKRALRL